MGEPQDRESPARGVKVGANSHFEDSTEDHVKDSRELGKVGRKPITLELENSPIHCRHACTV